MASFEDTDFFMDLSLVDDPYPYFDYLRSRGPVTRLPEHNVVAVTGFEEALAVHLDTEHFSAVNSVTGPLPPIPFVPEGDDITAQIEAHRPQMPFGEEVLTLDPPRHTPLRSLMMKLFTPSRLKEMESYLTLLADQLIDEFEARGACELVRDYSRPYATLAIADLLGVPEEDRNAFRVNAGGAPSQVGAGAAEVVNPMEFRHQKFLHYVEDRRASPRGDILSTLANATFPDGSMPDAMDVVRVATLLFGAGQDTTATLLGNCLKIIAEKPDLQAQLRAEPAGISAFIEEVLRFNGPVKSTFRLARKPTSLGGEDIPVGTTVMITTGAVNRDPRKFDEPAQFRIGRPGAKDHLAFGRGTHTCPGAPLARTETRISIERMLARLGEIAIDPERHGPEGDRRFSYLPTYVFRSLAELHLRFTG
ncbi:MAG: cytochrome P450 [Novosphingobium sp.]|nr:cytochrome P450 [Novosphingobium sp.]MCP5401487.1 cytochrome P450 [Novosphingobium sp.]